MQMTTPGTVAGEARNRIFRRKVAQPKAPVALPARNIIAAMPYICVR